MSYDERPTQRAAGQLALRLNERHPFVSALLSALFFVIAGGVATLYVLITSKSRPLESTAYVLTGVAVGGASTALWAYAFTRGFEVPGWVGRTSLALTLVVAAAAVCAVVTAPPVQVFCASVVAARLLPQSVLAVIQGVHGMRHPQMRGLETERAMAMGWYAGGARRGQSPRE